MLLDQNITAAIDQQIYQDLTDIYKFFKIQIISMEDLYMKLNQQQFYLDEIQNLKIQIKKIVITQEKILEKYRQKRKYLSAFKMIFYRFFSRIYQVLQNSLKKRTVKQSSELHHFFSSIQIIIYNTMSNESQQYFDSFTQILKECKIFSQRTINKPSEMIEINNQQQLNQKELVQNKKQQIKKEQDVKTISNSKIIMQVKQQPNKLIKKLSDSFLNHNCLYINFNSFKSVYYMSRNNKNDLYDEMIQRNKLIKGEINRYSKNYANYHLRKNRRNAKNHFSEISSTSRIPGKINDLSERKNNNESIIYNKQIQNEKLTYKLGSISFKKIESQNCKISFYETSTKFNQTNRTIVQPIKNKAKLNYQTKKVLLNFNKLSLKPINYEQKSIPYTIQKKKNRNIITNSKKKVPQNFQVVIQGRKYQQGEIKFNEDRFNQKLFCYNYLK